MNRETLIINRRNIPKLTVAPNPRIRLFHIRHSMSRPGLKQVTQAREMIDDIARDSCGNKLFTILDRVEAAQQATLLLHSTLSYALLLSSPMARDSNHDLTRPRQTGAGQTLSHTAEHTSCLIISCRPNVVPCAVISSFGELLTL